MAQSDLTEPDLAGKTAGMRAPRRPARRTRAGNGASDIERRYYMAMAAPFIFDTVISGIFTIVLGLPHLFFSNLLIAALVLLLGGQVWARYLFWPIRRFLRTGENFAATERRLTQLPLRSANFIAWLYLPILLYRLIAPLAFGYSLSGSPPATWTDAITTVVVQSLFMFVAMYFLISGYLERLLGVLFELHGVNLSLFFGRFAFKIIVALTFMAMAPLALLTGEIVSYEGERLMREVAIDLVAAAFGLCITLFWISRSLTRPLGRLAGGIDTVAKGDLSVRLPVTSNEEIGSITARFNRMIEDLRERQRIRETFGKYVSETVASALLLQSADGKLGGEMGEASLMFTDIDDFTRYCERLPPDVLISVLNEYLELVLEPIQRHGGVVNSFIGDGLFASFNLPLANKDHAEHAVAAAVEIQQALRSKVFPGNVQLTTRIGINTGTVVAGTIGAGERLSYTLLGDAVNIAARLQELNKLQGTRILIADTTMRQVKTVHRFRPIGEVEIRGRSERLMLYTVEF